MMNLADFEKSLDKLWPKPLRAGFLVAVSGGADSMVLLDCLRQLGLKPQVAHINYGLRGTDSQADEALVSGYCMQHQIKLHIYKVAEKAPAHGLQVWARDLRYSFFKEIQTKENLPYLFTGHHLEDQWETFVMNLSKAAGLEGLTGINGQEHNIIRPLLACQKKDIYALAAAENIPFREDKSNQKQDYTRNQIRHHITPEILKINDVFFENFAKTLAYLQEAKSYIGTKIESTIKDIAVDHPDYILVLNKDDFAHLSPFEQYHILKKYGFDDALEISKINSAKVGAIFLSENHEILVDRSYLFLRMKSPKQGVEIEIIMHEMQEVLLNQSKLKYEISTKANPDAYWVFDADKIEFPLVLRSQKTGDLFYPSGMNGKKLVSKYFKDEKINNFEKKDVILLCHHKQVLGLINYRQDKRCMVTETTTRFLNLYYKKHETTA